MALTIDVTDAGLDAGPDYFTNTGLQPPNVSVVDDGGRFGFDISDTTRVLLPEAAMVGSFFNSNAFSASLSFKAQDGSQSAGQLFRIHSNLHVTVNATGSFRVDFINESGVWSTLNSGATSGLDGNWHDLAISYDGAQGTFDLSLDGALLASGTASGNTKGGGQWGLNFGSIFGSTGFDGLIDDFTLDDNATAPPPPPPPPPPPVPTDVFSVDVTASGLDAGPDYQTEFGQPPPSVTVVQDSGRWGFDLDDGSTIKFPREALDGPYFSSDAFTVSLSMKAQDGISSAGEILRIHTSLQLNVNSDGSFSLAFTNDQSTKTTLNTSATLALDGQWHDLIVTFDDSLGTLAVYLDDAEIGSIPATAHNWALFLDFDTCIAAEGDGSAISVAPETRHTLIRLFHAFGGAITLLTER